MGLETSLLNVIDKNIENNNTFTDEMLINLTERTNYAHCNNQYAIKVCDYAFHNCDALTSINLPQATSIGYNAFGNCDALTSINLPRATSIGDNAFRNCYALTTVNLPQATSIGYDAFYSCSALTSIDLPLATSIGYDAFRDCSALTTLILRSETLCKLRYDDAFSNTPIASGTGYIYVPSALIEDYKADSNWSTYAAQFRALEDYTVDGTVTGELDETKI